MRQTSSLRIRNDPQHITIKCNNRENMFYEDSDYQYCLTQLKKAVDQFRCRLHAYVLTPENIQVLLSSQNNSCVVKAVELLEQEYMQHFNVTHRRIYRTLELDFSMVRVDEE